MQCDEHVPIRARRSIVSGGTVTGVIVRVSFACDLLCVAVIL